MACRCSVGAAGWHYFWCTRARRRVHQARRRGSCSSPASPACCRWPSAPSTAPTGCRPAACSVTAAASLLSLYLNRTGAAILLLTLAALSVILTTQFSFGRAATALGARLRVERGPLVRWREWREASAGASASGSRSSRSTSRRPAATAPRDRRQGRRRGRQAQGGSRPRPGLDVDDEDRGRASPLRRSTRRADRAPDHPPAAPAPVAQTSAARRMPRRRRPSSVVRAATCCRR